MRYRTPEAFRAALDQRLKNEATTASVALMRLRKRVAFERFLARLSAVDTEGWVLTGAFALDLRLGLGTRTTKDIDLARADDEQAATEHLVAAGAIDLGDYFDFEVRRTSDPDPVAGFRAVRYSIRADLAGRRFEQFPVDVALGEHSQDDAQRLRAPDLLAFADIDAPELPIVPLERQVAEKLHAYTGTFGARELESTRVKDLVDLVLIGDLAELDAAGLSRALESTFSGRATHPLPSAFPSPPTSWRGRMRSWPVRLASHPASTRAGRSLLVSWTRSWGSRQPVGRWDPKAKQWD